MTCAPTYRWENHGALRVPWFTLSFALGLAAVHVLFGGAAEGLIYVRTAIAGGEVWRLLTAHLTHIDAAHLFWNVGAFALMGWMLETQFKLPALRHAGLLLTAAAGVNTWLWFGELHLERYAGLSAILNAQFIVLVAMTWRETRHPIAVLAGLGGIGKVCAEIALGASLLTAPSWPPLPEAHATGLLMGGVWVVSAGWKFDAQPLNASIHMTREKTCDHSSISSRARGNTNPKISAKSARRLRI